MPSLGIAWTEAGHCVGERHWRVCWRMVYTYQETSCLIQGRQGMAFETPPAGQHARWSCGIAETAGTDAESSSEDGAGRD